MTDLFDAPLPPRRKRIEPEAAPKPNRKAWTDNVGKRPVAATTLIYARIRVLSREHVEERAPHPASYWTRWTILGEAGDIMEWRRA